MRREILAVHKQKLEEFLSAIGMWDPLIKGQLKCRICDESISIVNIGFIIPEDKEILICCSNPDCVFKYEAAKRGDPSDEI